MKDPLSFLLVVAVLVLMTEQEGFLSASFFLIRAKGHQSFGCRYRGLRIVPGKSLCLAIGPCRCCSREKGNFFLEKKGYSLPERRKGLCPVDKGRRKEGDGKEIFWKFFVSFQYID